MTRARRAIAIIAESAIETLRASRDLYAVMIPVIVAVKVLQELDWVRHVARPLEPLMRFVGLPADMGLVWAAGLFNGAYSALLVLMQLAQNRTDPLTVAQVTTLATLILIAHTLPVECGIAHRCGARFLGQCVLRFGVALACGAAYHAVTSASDLYQQAAAIPLPAPSANPGLTSWALGELRNLAMISCVIFALMLGMKLLRASGVLGLFTRAIGPLMQLIGISREAAAITVVGMTVGLAYGSGVILEEIRKGVLSEREVFFAVSLMGVCHSLIEDTLVMLLVGAEPWGLLGMRLAVGIAAIAALVRLVRLVPEGLARRFLWVSRAA